ncbi:MAG TPA: alpha/beta hydrolase [Epulopiscium sp.]|nr:alpha/beta hydrolase [Candidatus Epulonipiscium sp.]
MTKEKITFKNKDNSKIYVHKWSPDKEIKGIIQIAHGMAERAIRYDYFARALVKEGFIVYANDHRGHGESAASIEELGYISDHDGFGDMVEDMKTLTTIAKSENPDVPVILFSHSMGSFLGQRYIQLYGNEIDGIILSGTSGKPPSTVNIGIFLAKIMMRIKGRKASGKLLDKIAFGSYNKKFKPNKTKFDWLSRDEEEVAKYVEDPYCGTLFPVSFFYDLFVGMKTIHKPEFLEKVPKELPIYIFGGQDDPVSNYGAGISNLANTYKSLEIENITSKLYPGGRHEMLNEINKDEVIADITKWIKGII